MKNFRVYPIFGMSKDIKSMKAELCDQAGNIDIHLIKIAILPESANVNHWRQEIATFINKVHTLKGKNKRPSTKFILDATWGSIYDDIEFWRRGQERKYKSKCNVDDEVLSEMIEEYFTWLAMKLSHEGQVSRTEVYTKLDELVNVYLER